MNVRFLLTMFIFYFFALSQNCFGNIEASPIAFDLAEKCHVEAFPGVDRSSHIAYILPAPIIAKDPLTDSISILSESSESNDDYTVMSFNITFAKQDTYGPCSAQSILKSIHQSNNKITRIKDLSIKSITAKIEHLYKIDPNEILISVFPKKSPESQNQIISLTASPVIQLKYKIHKDHYEKIRTSLESIGLPIEYMFEVQAHSLEGSQFLTISYDKIAAALEANLSGQNEILEADLKIALEGIFSDLNIDILRIGNASGTLDIKDFIGQFLNDLKTSNPGGLQSGNNSKSFDVKALIKALKHKHSLNLNQRQLSLATKSTIVLYRLLSSQDGFIDSIHLRRVALVNDTQDPDKRHWTTVQLPTSKKMLIVPMAKDLNVLNKDPKVVTSRYLTKSDFNSPVIKGLFEGINANLFYDPIAFNANFSDTSDGIGNYRIFDISFGKTPFYFLTFGTHLSYNWEETTTLYSYENIDRIRYNQISWLDQLSEMNVAVVFKEQGSLQYSLSELYKNGCIEDILNKTHDPETGVLISGIRPEDGLVAQKCIPNVKIYYYSTGALELDASGTNNLTQFDIFQTDEFKVHELETYKLVEKQFADFLSPHFSGRYPVGSEKIINKKTSQLQEMQTIYYLKLVNLD